MTFFFFRLQSSHWSVHFLQSWAEHLRPSPPKANFTPKGPPFHFLLFQGNLQNRTCPKGPPFGFFRHCATFFPNFFCLQRVPRFIFYFFNVTYKTGRAQRVPPLDFFRHCATFFRKFFNVPKGSPLWVFWYFATECLLINPEGSPFYIFRHYATSFERKFFFKNFNFFQKKCFTLFEP